MSQEHQGLLKQNLILFRMNIPKELAYVLYLYFQQFAVKVLLNGDTSQAAKEKQQISK